MTFTDEQYAAIINDSHNLLVTAGAGSGKTRVLVEHYLAMLDQHPDWQLTDLVAITFTQKAAREMRDRIRQTLRERVKAASTPAEQSRWRDLEAQLDQARISTIHTLCADLLRANPAQVPVDPAFDVLEENEANLLLAEAIEAALASLAEQPAGQLLLLYSDYEIRKVMAEYAPRSTGQAILEGLPSDPQALLDQWAAQYQTAMTDWLTQLRQDEKLWGNLSWQPGPHWPSLDDKLMQVWAAVHALIPQLESNNPSQVYESLQAIDAAINLRVGAEKNWGNKALLSEAKGALGAIRSLARDYLTTIPLALSETDSEMAHRLTLWRGAVQLAMQHYAAAKTRRAALDFDDLETRAVELLHTYPDVAQRYAGRLFKHLMVDEFQDTNARQRDLVYRLCGIEAEQADNPNGRLFVVGDPKQSIYAFRGADVAVFREVGAAILAWGGLELPLSRSFRTHERLVTAFNRLFERLLTDDGVGYSVPFDRPMSAQRPMPEDWEHPPIEMILLDAPKGWLRDDLARWEAYEIGSKLQQWHAEQRPVFDKAMGDYRPFQYGDAAILLRSLGKATLYEEVFKALGLPYVTLGGRGYYNRQEVWDVLNLLKALHNPQDHLALASALRSPMVGLSDDGLLALRWVRDAAGQRLGLWEALYSDPADWLFPLPAIDQAPLTFAREVLDQLRGLAGRVTVEALLEAALEATAYEAILMALPDGERRCANLEKLLELARTSGRIELSEFLLYIGNLSEREAREGEAVLESGHAIQIMSVHKSKGLEFPLVILANSDWSRHERGEFALIYDPHVGAACRWRDDENEAVETFAWREIKRVAAQRDLAEHKRLLYVAATRAQDYLWVLGKLPINEPNPETWLGMLLQARQEDSWLEAAFPITTPPPPDLLEVLGRRAPEVTGWQAAPDSIPLVAEQLPPLVAPLPYQPRTALRHLSVSQLEQLGYYGQQSTEAIKRSFRQSVLHDAPAPVRPLRPDPSMAHRLMRRAIGQIVHRALQVQALPQRYERAALQQILEAYAWDEGISDPQLSQEVVQEAYQLLERYQSAHLPASFAQADEVLREVPFIYRLGGRVIHGVMDVIYRYGDQWYVLDYKTADISARSVPEHAKRYAIQLGAYAQALQERLGSSTPPTVQLYYLHPGEWIELPPAQWAAAMRQFEHWVQQALT